MFDVLNEIWELPWYQVFIVAVADDAILFIKLWPVYVAVIVVSIAVVLFGLLSK